jgi:hypothetical protein
MGGSVSTAERWRSLREGTRNACAPNRLRLDENRSNLGGPSTLDCRHDHQSSAAVVAKQGALLRQLIGERQADSGQIAMRLMSAFGSLGGVLSATPEALAKVVEDSSLVDRLAAAKPAVLEYLGECVLRISFDLADVALQQWIVSLFKGFRRERILLCWTRVGA